MTLTGRRRTLVLATLVSIGNLASAGPPDDARHDLWGGRRVFAARLSADYQPVVTHSAGIGEVRIELDLATRQAVWEIRYSGLTSAPTAVGLHGPAQPGTNGAQLIDLGGKSLSSPIRGRAVIPAGQIQYMLLGWTYVLVATRRYPQGELRGKVDVVPPEQTGPAQSAPAGTAR